MGLPTTDISVIIPTYGDDIRWKERASHAWYSAVHQSLRPQVIRQHGETLAATRNAGAERALTSFIIFLDADDTLDLGYVEAMHNALEGSWGKSLWRPSTLGVVDGVEDNEPVMITRRPLADANFMVIGTMMFREEFLDLGGFDETLPVLEDWELWLRFGRHGAEVMDVPEAIYRVNVRTDGRNSDVDLHHRTYKQIRNRHASAIEHGYQG